ncbi:MAG: type IV pilus twitching motility protein PilT [Planctomycetes bacterium]|nr:type IV pilus twitching motility protein PilT [Planctomycetota bacterium]
MYDIFQLMEFTLQCNGSDLHLSVGRPPTIRVSGRMRNVKGEPLTADDTIHLANQFMPPRMKLEFREKGGADFGYAHSGPSGKCRFRVAVYRQKGCVGVVLRLLPSRILTFDQIGLQPQIKELLHRSRGLVLVTGPTGSGKTTTLATMVDYINQNFDHHIVTIEDPVEYYHEHKKSIVTQREIGSDVGSFKEAMKRVLRMDPDVILLGEMRDLETISTAITAAETGHLVLGTLHTTGSARTIDRIIDAFPSDQQEQCRAQLSVSLLAVISQVIMGRADKEGLIAGFEVMMMNSAIENLIRKNETFKIKSVLQTHKNAGMVLLDEHLWDLYKAGKISKESILLKSQDPKEIQRKLDFDELGGAPGATPPPAPPSVSAGPTSSAPSAPSTGPAQPGAARPSSIFQRKPPQ